METNTSALQKWDDYYRSGQDFDVVTPEEIAKIWAALEGVPGTALDLGCGTGDLLQKLAERGLSVTGVDWSEPALKQARERVPKGTFLQADLDHLPVDFLADQKFDLIFLNKVIAFVNREAILRFCGLHLAAGGSIIVITPYWNAKEGTERPEISVDSEAFEGEARHLFQTVERIYTLPRKYGQLAAYKIKEPTFA